MHSMKLKRPLLPLLIRVWFACALILVSAALSFPAQGEPAAILPATAANGPTHAHAILLFIGDGMGAEHREAGRWSAVGLSGQLAMDTLSVSGMLQTASADYAVTDSAASATAMATGVKTKNGYIGVDPDGDPLETILETAEGRGMATGLVTTVEVSHATPAAFAAHITNRNLMLEIASQMIVSGVDVLLGGGEDQYLPPTEVGCRPGMTGLRTDGRNLVDEAQAAGFTFVCDVAGLAAVDTLTTVQLLGLFSDAEMQRPYAPTLAEMTESAIEILSRDPQGFFLMVEGGRIDKAAHLNDGQDVIDDVIGFDEAVQVGLDYAALHADTLVIVAADHETGGMMVDTMLPPSGTPDVDNPFDMPDITEFYITWSTTDHTAADVPVTAAGPWSTLFDGTHQNTTVFTVMRRAIDWWVWMPLLSRP
jgi:alkaline phosphatase